MVVFLSVVVLVLFEGSSVRQASDDMQPGFERDVVHAVGQPTGWVADRLPFDEWGDDALAFIEDEGAGEGAGFGDARRADAATVPAVSPDSFAPRGAGREARAAARPRQAARDRRLARHAARHRDGPAAGRERRGGRRGARSARGHGHLEDGAGELGKLSGEHVAEREPDATVVFIGANEGFSMPGADGKEVDCCGPDWAAEFAYRVRSMMNTYRQGGAARVYWLTLPLPAIPTSRGSRGRSTPRSAWPPEPYRAQVRVLDMTALFTPEGYRDAMEVDGRRQIVRDPDGIHLNSRGAELAADVVLEAIRRDFGG